MTPDEFSADVDLVLETVRDADLSEAFKSIREDVLKSVGDNFFTATSPAGAAWPERKSGGDHPLLIKSGALKAAATGKGPGHVTFWHPRELHVGVDPAVGLGGIPGARRHNEGDPAYNLAQREFMGPSDATLEHIDDQIADAIDSKLKG